MIPGSKGLNPHGLAHKWVKDLGTRPNIKNAGHIVTGIQKTKAKNLYSLYPFTAPAIVFRSSTR